MTKAATPNRWFPGWRAPEPAVEVDAADLGTAFGLDMSLNELRHEPPPTVRASRQPGWVQRLASRRKPIA
jgi:hypothetical protein